MNIGGPVIKQKEIQKDVLAKMPMIYDWILGLLIKSTLQNKIQLLFLYILYC